jgi:hypothetical protein
MDNLAINFYKTFYKKITKSDVQQVKLCKVLFFHKKNRGNMKENTNNNRNFNFI